MSISSNKSGINELVSRILFVLLGILIFRFGAQIIIPGLNPETIGNFMAKNNDTLLGMFNMFSGGSLQHLAIFSLGVMPYISASIIFQMLTVVVPSLEELKKEGETGRKKITKYTRIATLFLALFQSLGVAKFLVSGNYLLPDIPVYIFYVSACVTLTTGSMLLMWLGEQMTERGVGNGISMLIFAGIVAGLPSALVHTFNLTKQGSLSLFGLLLIGVLALVVIVIIIAVERAQRRIRVEYARRMQGRKMSMPQSSHLPLKINMAGVIPPIFASSIMLFPATLSHWFGGDNPSTAITFLNKVGLALSPGQPLYIVVFSAAVIFFCFFYTALVFNPKDTADNLKKSGAVIPGIRPGEQTAKYIDNVMSRLTLFGSIYIVLVCLLPTFLIQFFNVPFYFGGTSLLIVIVVLMDFIAQVQAHLMSSQYGSVLKKANMMNL